MNPQTQKFTVCFAISGPNTRGGIERHVFDLSKGLTEYCRVVVLAHASYSGWFVPEVELIELRFDRWRYSPLLSSELTSKIQSIQPDLIHVHGRKAAEVISRLRHHFEAKCIVTLHNLNVKPKHYEKFDQVIAVSSGVAKNIDDPRLKIIPNGC